MMISKRVWRATLASAILCVALARCQPDSQARALLPDRWRPAAAADYMDGRQAWWLDWPGAARGHDTACLSCHTSLPYALARPALRTVLGEAGPTIPEARLLDDVRKRVTLWNEVRPYYADQSSGLPKTSESRGTEAILNALVLANRDASDGHLTSETRRAFDILWGLQFTQGERTGAWAWLHFYLAPWESDGAAYFGAALAAVAVGVAPDDYASSDVIHGQLELLRAYLLADPDSRLPLDRVMLLWASAELTGLATDEQRQALIADILRLQNGDGGWRLTSLGPWRGGLGRFTPDRASDGYATGLIAFVLQRAGVSTEREELSRALTWLVQNQDPTDGHWPSSSLNKERDPDSRRGRFMADAATAFAVLALTQAGTCYETEEARPTDAGVLRRCFRHRP